MKFGQFEIRTFVEQTMKFDGGAAFGVIPKKLWSQRMNDENNLVTFCNNYMVLTANGKNFILDGGIGPDLSEAEQKVYSCGTDSRLEEGLRQLGLGANDIDYILLTHLHTDHMAGTVQTVDGELMPRFPKAKVIATKEEFKVATNPNERTSAVYRPERVHALKNAGLLELVDANNELFPGITIVHTGGHTEGHYAVHMESDGEKVLFYSDVIPTRHHLDIAWVAGLDLFPLETMDVKRKLMPQMVDEGSVLALVHDTEMPFITVQRDGKHFVAKKPAGATQTA